MDNANKSSVGFDVIWQSIMSSPRISDKTKAGRRLLPDKSVKGKGVITISPFINLSKIYPLRGLTNLLPKRFLLQGMFAHYLLSFLSSLQPCHPICVPTPTKVACYFSTCCVSLMFPLFNFLTKIYEYSVITKKIPYNLQLIN